MLSVVVLVVQSLVSRFQSVSLLATCVEPVVVSLWAVCLLGLFVSGVMPTWNIVAVGHTLNHNLQLCVVHLHFFILGFKN